MSHSDAYVWGPPAWGLFHTRALESRLSGTGGHNDGCGHRRSHCSRTRGGCLTPEQLELQDFYTRQFFRYLNCQTCRREYSDILRTIPPDLSSTAALFRWTVTVHNIVNNKLGKPMVSLQQAYAIWGGCQEEDDTYVFQFRI